jgi:hypothetical protein
VLRKSEQRAVHVQSFREANTVLRERTPEWQGQKEAARKTVRAQNVRFHWHRENAHSMEQCPGSQLSAQWQSGKQKEVLNFHRQ